MMPRCQPASPRRFTRDLVPPRWCKFVCVPVFRQRQQALPAILLFFPLRIPPTWRPPRHPSANPSYLEVANVINPQQPDHTSHRVCEFLLPGGCRRHPSRAARSHQPLCLKPLPFPELEPEGCLEPLPFQELEPTGRRRRRDVKIPQQAIPEPAHEHVAQLLLVFLRDSSGSATPPSTQADTTQVSEKPIVIRRCSRTASCPKAPSSDLCRLKKNGRRSRKRKTGRRRPAIHAGGSPRSRDPTPCRSR